MSALWFNARFFAGCFSPTAWRANLHTSPTDPRVVALNAAVDADRAGSAWGRSA